MSIITFSQSLSGFIVTVVSEIDVVLVVEVEGCVVISDDFGKHHKSQIQEPGPESKGLELLVVDCCHLL